MAVKKANFPFKEKEGKFFAPIVGTTNIRNGVKVPGALFPKSGTKGTYAKVKFELPVDIAGERTELFAISTEVFNSSR